MWWDVPVHLWKAGREEAGAAQGSWIVPNNLILWHIRVRQRLWGWSKPAFPSEASTSQLPPLLAPFPFPSCPRNCFQGICTIPHLTGEARRVWKKPGTRSGGDASQGPLRLLEKTKTKPTVCLGDVAPPRVRPPCLSPTCWAASGFGEKPHVSKWLLQVASYKKRGKLPGQ